MNLDHQDEDVWGDDPTVKHHDVLRIASQNVRGLPNFASGYKNQQINETIKKFDIDVLLLSEINIHWRATDAYNSWYEGTKI